MRVLLSGSSGFVGSGIRRSLLEQRAHVGVIRRGEPASNPGSDSVLPADARLREAVIAFAPDVVIHAATHFVREHTPADVPQLVESNIEFGTRLLDAASVTNARFISLSSAWQHYEGKEYSPVNLYAATKQAFDDIAVYYKSEGLHFSRITLFDTYGPSDARRKFVSLILEAARSGSPLLASSGRQLIDLTYVQDVVDTVTGLALRHAGDPPIDAVVRSGAVSLREVVEIAEDAIGVPVPVVWGARPDAAREMTSDWKFGITLPGWQPEIDLHTGLKITWQHDWCTVV